MPTTFTILMILELLTVLSIIFLPALKQFGGAGTRSKTCCGMKFRPKTLRVGKKELDIDHMNFTIQKHSNMAKMGIQPLVPLHEELGITKKQLHRIL